MLVLAQLLGGEDVVGLAQHRLLVVRLPSQPLHKPVILSQPQQHLHSL